ncbi:MAG: four helix bundle protein [Lysobacterales bacterium]
MVRSYRDLEVWQRSMASIGHVYAIAAALPTEERYALASQLRRAAVSIPANIAEGHARMATRDFARFIAIALGSVAELETLLHLTDSLHSLHHPACQPLFAELDQIGKMLRALHKSLRSKAVAAPSSQPPAPSP